MWQQIYTPVAASLGLSALAAALPIVTLVYTLGVRRMPSWKASLIGLAAAELIALFIYRMPVLMSLGAITYGAAFGLFPIGWIVYWAIVLYRITLETGQFEIVKNSIGNLTPDRRLQALLIAFAFGAFMEGACGFGTPVAVAAAMLTGLGFSPFYAAAICLLANTAPVAFGSVGLPLVTLSGITGISLVTLSSNVGRICAPISLVIPAYLMLVMGGWRALKAVFPAVLVCGVTFAGTQLFVSNVIGPYLTDILGSVVAMAALIILLQFWKPRQVSEGSAQNLAAPVNAPPHSTREVLIAWAPYALLVVFVLVWGLNAVKAGLDFFTITIPWPALHNHVQRIPPVVAKAAPYAAVYTFNWLSISGTACMFAALLSCVVLRMSPHLALRLLLATLRQLLHPLVTIAAIVGLAFLMNYCGATATLGLAFAASAVFFPFFSPLLGWLGVFLTGSDTASNALFGNLQVVTANRLGLNPALMAAANSSGGVMGKMISLQSIAVAGAATEMKPEEEGRLFRFTLRHSILLASLIGLITLLYAYLLPHWVK
ncbi:MAG TPA: L-lactate permease [Terriglobia bacterium]|nr:L-lactate permease [Terriglobia bacterium]